MPEISDSVSAFFREFEEASNRFDGIRIAALFSDPYLAADPHGAVRVASRDEMLAGVARRQAYFDSLGLQSVRVSPVQETRLADRYLMVRCHAAMRFEKQPGQPVDVSDDTVSILFTGEGRAPRIVFSLTHGDLAAIMREHGLLS